MAIDAIDYRKRVLSVFAKRRISEVQAAIRELDQSPGLKAVTAIDIAEFYDIVSPASDAEVAAHLAVVEDTLNKAALNASLKTSAPNLIGLHQRLTKTFPDLRTKSFWDGVLEQRMQRAKQGFEEFGRIAAAEFATLGVVTAARLRQVAKASGIADVVSDAELAEAMEAGGVVVVAELPSVTTLPRTLKEISDGIRKTSCRSVLSAIFVKQGEPDNFAIVDGFHSASGVTLTLATVHESHDQIDRLPDSDEYNAIGKVLGAVRRAVRTDAELHMLVVGSFIERAKEIMRDTPMQLGALNELMRTGLDRRDAARIIQALSSTGGGQPQGYREVQEYVVNGQLKDARRLYEAVYANTGTSESEEQVKALTAVENAERMVADLRNLAEEAVRTGDLATARKALNDALTICSDDEALTAIANALPPATPLNFVAAASEDGTAAQLTWDPGFGSTEDVRYQVIRKVGSPPRNSQDGAAIGKALTAMEFEDRVPPVATEVFYAVAATRGGGFSPVAAARVVILPPVADVRASSDDTSVTLRWTTPPDAHGVEATQTAPDGTTTRLNVGAHSGTTSSGLVLGATYTYLITAAYLTATGGELRSTTMRVTAVPRGEAKALASFSLQHAGSDIVPEAEATWTAIPGYVVEIWHFPQRPSWTFGARVHMSSVRSGGMQLAGRPAAPGPRRQGVRGTTAAGLRYYVIVTRDGDDGVIGQVQSFGTAPAVSNVHAERFGDEAVIAWEWPGENYQALVRWKGGDSSGERTISPSRYRSEGGCRIQLGTAGGKVEVLTVATDGESQWMSSPVVANVVGTVPVSYDVDFQKRLFGPPTGATLRFRSDGPIAPFEVVVIGQLSKFMPFDQTQGSVLVRTMVTPGDAEGLTVALPRGKGTLWVRAFSAAPGVRLVDPSPTRMKVD